MKIVLGSSNSLLDSLGLDMKISIPTQGTGKPLSSSVICQLVEHVEDKLRKTAYDVQEFKSICTSIANLASLGLLELGLTSHNNDGKFIQEIRFDCRQFSKSYIFWKKKIFF